ncbi:MAG: rhamnogalacturonan acetylesterase [Chitinispirillaceae bacterium]|nr:rhamnogalacturonan acetylesterase [Chitinispirillaceae bacterium]
MIIGIGDSKKKAGKPGSGIIVPVVAVVAFFTAIVWAARSTALRIVIIGDSTVQTYGASDPLRGWGQELPYFFNKNTVTVINKSIGGRSSRSFIEDGHWASTLSILQKGDFLFIQFGHNDRSTVTERHADTAQYRKYLTQYVTESRAKGAIPVLVSPMNMNAWNGTTLREVFNEGVNDYHAAMLRVVNASKVPFIDLEKKTAEIFRRLGQRYLAIFIFNPGEGTHFQEMGALLNARLVAEGIKELEADAGVGKLAAALAPQYMVTIASNKSGAGMITESGTYPQGASLIVKTVPNTGEKFQHWQNGSGTSLTTDTSYHFTMGAAEASYTAMYQSGTTMLSEDAGTAVSRRKCAVTFRRSTEGMIVVRSEEPIFSVRVCDIAGRNIPFKRLDDRRVAFTEKEINGARVIAIETPSGSFTRRVRLVR